MLLHSGRFFLVLNHNVKCLCQKKKKTRPNKKNKPTLVFTWTRSQSLWVEGGALVAMVEQAAEMGGHEGTASVLVTGPLCLWLTVVSLPSWIDRYWKLSLFSNFYFWVMLAKCSFFQEKGVTEMKSWIVITNGNRNSIFISKTYRVIIHLKII